MSTLEHHCKGMSMMIDQIADEDTLLETSSGMQATIVLASVIAIVWLYHYATADARLKKLPPGPRGLPLVGSILSFANADKIPSVLLRWKKKYGEIVHAKIGQQHFIFLSSPKVVKELMDKRGSTYSSRPHMPMAFDATSNQRRQFFMPYGQRWRSVRKISHAALNLKTSNSYMPVQDFESKQVLYELLHIKNDYDFYDINRRYASSVIMTVTYGHRIESWDDPIYRKIFAVLEHFTLMAEPGKWLVDSIPALTRLPSWMVQDWWRIGRSWHAHDSKIYLDLYRTLTARVDKGDAPDCFVKDFYLGDPEKNGIDEECAAYTAGSMVEAGSESTSTAINSWLLACLLFPDSIKAGQEELDRVVGSDRLPTFEDEASLPYISAIAKEVLRWRPITKIGAPHSNSQDDWYDGYFIPKDSIVVLSWWAIHFDDTIWTDPDAFDPSRYMKPPFLSLTTAESMTTADPNARDHFTYGAGRRACPGVHLAQNSLFINIARTLWAFNIEKARDDKGNISEPPTETESGFLAIPVRFPCRFGVRSEKHARIIQQDWEYSKNTGLDWSRRSGRT